MKKILILSALLLVSGLAWAEDAALPAETTPTAEPAASTAPAAGEEQKEKTIIVYDVYKHMENSSAIFLGIGGISFAIGAAMSTVAHENAIMLGAGISSVAWGAAETGIYLLNRNFGQKELDPEKARAQYADMSGLHAIIDLAVMAGGGCMAIFGNDFVKGVGMSMLIEGAMLAAYDGINFFIASNPQDVKDWGAGVGYNIHFAAK